MQRGIVMLRIVENFAKSLKVSKVIESGTIRQIIITCAVIAQQVSK